MCKDHSGVLVEIPTASMIFRDGTPRPNRNKRGIDACIAPLVKALNDAGVGTVASCCGHDEFIGNIALADGRELVIAPSFNAARVIEQWWDSPASGDALRAFRTFAAMAPVSSGGENPDD